MSSCGSATWRVDRWALKTRLSLGTSSLQHLCCSPLYSSACCWHTNNRKLSYLLRKLFYKLFSMRYSLFSMRYKLFRMSYKLFRIFYSCLISAATCSRSAIRASISLRKILNSLRMHRLTLLLLLRLLLFKFMFERSLHVLRARTVAYVGPDRAYLY